MMAHQNQIIQTRRSTPLLNFHSAKLRLSVSEVHGLAQGH